MGRAVKRSPVIARCYVLRADRNGHVWYVDDEGYTTSNPKHARDHATLETARIARAEVFWPEWRIWRRGRRA